MFEHPAGSSLRTPRWAIIILAFLSLTGLLLTTWMFRDFSREQMIIKQLMGHLPSQGLSGVQELAGELRLHWRLTALLVLNLSVLGVAIALLGRAYLTSERSLRDARVLATDILASIDLGIITTDREGRVLSLNPCARQLLHRSRDGTGIAVEELGSDHALLSSICRRVLAEKVSVRDKDYVVHRNGNERHLRAGCSLLRDSNNQELGTVLHFRDVTEKVMIERRLRRMERYMGLGTLAAGLHHEIKNPLSALSLHVQLLREALRRSGIEPGVQEILDVLLTETRRIAAVLEGFRDYVSIAELDRTSVDIASLFSRISKLAAPKLQQ